MFGINATVIISVLIHLKRLRIVLLILAWRGEIATIVCVVVAAVATL